MFQHFIDMVPVAGFRPLNPIDSQTGSMIVSPLVSSKAASGPYCSLKITFWGCLGVYQNLFWEQQQMGTSYMMVVSHLLSFPKRVGLHKGNPLQNILFRPNHTP